MNRVDTSTSARSRPAILSTSTMSKPRTRPRQGLHPMTSSSRDVIQDLTNRNNNLALENSVLRQKLSRAQRELDSLRIQERESKILNERLSRTVAVLMAEVDCISRYHREAGNKIESLLMLPEVQSLEAIESWPEDHYHPRFSREEQEAYRRQSMNRIHEEFSKKVELSAILESSEIGRRSTLLSSEMSTSGIQRTHRTSVLLEDASGDLVRRVSITHTFTQDEYVTSQGIQPENEVHVHVPDDVFDSEYNSPRQVPGGDVGDLEHVSSTSEYQVVPDVGDVGSHSTSPIVHSTTTEVLVKPQRKPRQLKKKVEPTPDSSTSTGPKKRKPKVKKVVNEEPSFSTPMKDTVPHKGRRISKKNPAEPSATLEKPEKSYNLRNRKQTKPDILDELLM